MSGAVMLMEMLPTQIPEEFRDTAIRVLDTVQTTLQEAAQPKEDEPDCDVKGETKNAIQMLLAETVKELSGVEEPSVVITGNDQEDGLQSSAPAATETAESLQVRQVPR